MFEKINQLFLDTLFPIRCVSCKKYDCFICEECFSKIEIKNTQLCPYCEKVFSEQGKACPQCVHFSLTKNSPLPLDGLISSTSYKNKLLTHLVHLFKYNFIPDMSIPLGRIVTQGLLKNNIPLPDIIIPVPLHPRRLRWRGFNQSEKLAIFIGETLAPGFSIPVKTKIVFRKKYTTPQMKIRDYDERKKNIARAFSLQEGKESIQNKNILLVDDICTTGATLFEIGHLLKENDAGKVFGTVIARQEIR
jgi:competence protein ComFC